MPVPQAHQANNIDVGLDGRTERAEPAVMYLRLSWEHTSVIYQGGTRLIINHTRCRADVLKERSAINIE